MWLKRTNGLLKYIHPQTKLYLSWFKILNYRMINVLSSTMKGCFSIFDWIKYSWMLTMKAYCTLMPNQNSSKLSKWKSANSQFICFYQKSKNKRLKFSVNLLENLKSRWTNALNNLTKNNLENWICNNSIWITKCGSSLATNYLEATDLS